MSIFSKIEKTHVKSNTFDLTHDVKLSAQFGKLVPICIMDTIPGDNFHIKGNALVRLAPMLAPVMHRANVYLHYFFVPNRILWNNWEDFITGGRLGNDTSVHPYFNYNPSSWPAGLLPDHMGLPPTEDVPDADYNIQVNALPFAAYQKIYNDYYRDQNFLEEVPFELNNGENTFNNFTAMRDRAWKHDYFTSALPWTQRGPEVLLPLGEEAPLALNEQANGDVYQFFRDYQTPHNQLNNQGPVETTSSGATQRYQTSGTDEGYISVEDSHYADLSAATASSINDLRRAFRLQEWLEKNARGGSRYIEQIAVHFGVNSSDKRLQRAEYIGGVSSPIKFSEVLQTSNNDTQTTPQGTMAGHGISLGGTKSYSYYAEEHGYIIGMMSVLPDTAYEQGIQKHYFRADKLDYAFPSFAHIGEQPIFNGEVMLGETESDVLETWGYTPRYAEYKYMNNRVAGDFRTSLDFWHMGRKFEDLPPLNIDFINCDNSEVDRIFAVQGAEDNLWIQVLNEVKATRKLPIFGTPTI